MLKSLRKLNESVFIRPHNNSAYFQASIGAYGVEDINHLPYENESLTLIDNNFCLLRSIKISTSISPIASLNLVITTSDGSQISVPYTGRNKNYDREDFIWELNRVAYKVCVQIPSDLLESDNFRVLINGRELVSFDNDLNNFLSEFKTTHDQVQELEESISTKEKCLEELDETLKENQEIAEARSNTIEQLETDYSNTVRKLNDAVIQFEQNVQKNKQIKSELDKNQNLLDSEQTQLKQAKENKNKITYELKKLEIERSKYSEDFETFKEESTTQNYLYLSILVITAIVFASVFHQLLNGAYELVLNLKQNDDILTVLLSRLPTVVLYSGVIGLTAKIILTFINLLTSNLNEVKQLKKVVYLISYVSESQSSDLQEQGLQIKDIYQKRVNEKMRIVRELFNIDIKHVEEDQSNILEKATELTSNVSSLLNQNRTGQ
ncbi:hypothetical protein [Vibrio europaeus]|uniref:Uncharacterized protein n=1 Tax=Vibrio europaeus TaxID=300876 RepID=A0A178J5G1_9VIBR|nr:hypothetical protein [Vibrio europaeus]MDC5706658.1 hypothetical protein [Vibrio europaeus]MDC5711809.1 hypothetical protein [Vibrio europaeus]MDC5716498.1 hypothetical protein [Vibrio europaeus]MDC5725797.1 hypothetical protein [Vibrio europaeus]MDC5732786.1 hypothetical protein [Vibrio europaeus]